MVDGATMVVVVHEVVAATMVVFVHFRSLMVVVRAVIVGVVL